MFFMKKIIATFFFILWFMIPCFSLSEEDAAVIYRKGIKAFEEMRFQEALNYSMKSYNMYLKLKKCEKIANNLNLLGLICSSLFKYEKALVYHEDALKIFIKKDIPLYMSTSFNNIGFVYYSIGHYEKALSYFQMALDIRKKLGINRLIAININNIALVYAAMGLYKKALSGYEDSLKIFSKLKMPKYTSIIMNNIGSVYSSMQNYKNALDYYNKAYTYFKKIKHPYYTPSILNNIALVHLSRKEFRKAEKKLNRAIEEEKRSGTKSILHSGMVEVYLATGRYQNALSLIKELTPSWNISDSSFVQYCSQLGMALKGKKKYFKASHEFLNGVLTSEEMRHRIKERSGFLKATVYGGHIRSYRGLIESLCERALNGEKIDKKFLDYGKDLKSNAFYFSELIKARTLLEAMAKAERNYSDPDIPLHMKTQEENILNQLAAIENHWEEAYKKGEKAFKTLQKRKKLLQKRHQSIISIFKKKFPLYAALKYPKPVLAENLPLTQKEVLLEYAICDKESYLFRVTKGGVEKIIRIPIGKEKLKKKITNFIIPLQKMKGKFNLSLAKKLYKLLLKKALKDISPEKDIIIIPDGILGLLPFEALIIRSNKNNRDIYYTGDRWNFSYSQSAAVLALNRLKSKIFSSRPLFALGNPIFNKTDQRYITFKKGNPPPKNLEYKSNDNVSECRAVYVTRGRHVNSPVYYPLPETEVEIREIAKQCKIKPVPPDILLNIDANETNLRKTELNKYIYIHFATHADLGGMVSGINEPFLLLGQVENDTKDDGILTMTEVLELKLNAELVVISACGTGRGKMIEGEGVMNFARSFHYAGARSVVVSLWNVGSDITVEYMKKFYTFLKEGKGKSEAFILTRREIRSIYPHPFYWAVFILYGAR